MLKKWKRATFLRTMPFIVERGGAEESRKEFFMKVLSFLPEGDPRYKKIKKAYDYAESASDGKLRESGERSFSHSRATALILISCLKVRDHHLIIAALLHDLVEDYPEWTVGLIEQKFGKYVAILIDYLTKPPRGKFASKELCNRVYRLQFRFAPRAFFLVKLSDRLHNILTLGACSRTKQIRQIKETRLHYLLYAKKWHILYEEIKEALEEAEERLKV